MKILKKSIVVIKCNGCGTIFSPDNSDIVPCGPADTKVNTKCYCPSCGAMNLIRVMGRTQNNVTIKYEDDIVLK
jgi:rubredoxin